MKHRARASRRKAAAAEPLRRHADVARREPTMSMRLVYPFVAAAKRSGIDPKILRFLERSDRDARILVTAAMELLRLGVRITGNEALGLCAALETTAGDYGDLEYAGGSSSTVGEALDFVCHNYFVMDEASTLRYRCAGGRVEVTILQPQDLFCDAAIDFTLSMMYLAYVRWVGAEPRDYEVRFPYPEPADLAPYGRVFGPRTKLCFGAKSTGVSFRQADMCLPLKHSDPKLHVLLAGYVRQRYAAERNDACLIDTTRMHILRALSQGPVTIERVAAQMGMSRRTLARRLEEQGTTFRQLLGDVRCASAVRYLLLEGMSIEEISAHLGYSEAAAFHRAFRGWFGQTPSAYRERKRR